MCDIPPPPAKFNYGTPEQYVVHQVPHKVLWQRAKVRRGTRVLGYYDPVTNEIFLWDTLRGNCKDTVLRHEIAHANGWRH